MCALLPEDWNLVLRTHIRLLTAGCSQLSALPRRSDPFFSFLQALAVMSAVTINRLIHLHILKTKKYIKKKQDLVSRNLKFSRDTEEKMPLVNMKDLEGGEQFNIKETGFSSVFTECSNDRALK